MNQAVNWQPTAPINNLLKRATILNKIRQFFSERGVLEVETPIMSHYSVTDIHLQPFVTEFVNPGAAQGQKLYLMTSPEYHMKRLLAAGSGPIYQMGRSFRNEEAGRYHNPEFTMLEWYRPHFDMFQLINEVDDLLQMILDYDNIEMITYQKAFLRHLELDPLTATTQQLSAAATKLGLADLAAKEQDRDELLQMLFTFGIEPLIGQEKPIVVYYFPASQAVLAKISNEDSNVAERFEVYYQGVELANGFCELTDAQEQRKRFEADNIKRQTLGLPQRPIDELLIAALTHGLPDTSGVALGVDRLIMLALAAKSIDEVLAFPVSIA